MGAWAVCFEKLKGVIADSTDEKDRRLPMETLGLVEVLSALREDLVVAKKDMRDDLQLKIDEIELELQTVVTKEGEGKIKIGILNAAKLLGLGGGDIELKGKLANVATQKIKMKISAESIDSDTGKRGSTCVGDTVPKGNV